MEEEIQIIEDLVLLLIYLTSWEEKSPGDSSVLRSWKGYPFDVLDSLIEKGFVTGSRRAKSVYLTDEGEEKARKIWGFLLPLVKDRKDL